MASGEHASGNHNAQQQPMTESTKLDSPHLACNKVNASLPTSDTPDHGDAADHGLDIDGLNAHTSDVDAFWDIFRAAKEAGNEGEVEEYSDGKKGSNEFGASAEQANEERRVICISDMPSADAEFGRAAEALKGGLKGSIDIDTFLDDLTDNEKDSDHASKIGNNRVSVAPTLPNPPVLVETSSNVPTKIKRPHGKNTLAPKKDKKEKLAMATTENDKKGLKKKKSAKAKREEIEKAEHAFEEQQREEQASLNVAIDTESPAAPGDRIVTGTNRLCPSPKELAALKYQPVSHEPILAGEFGYGRFKSRLIFEADPCAPKHRYGTAIQFTGNRITSTHRMSATQKFRDWRNKGIMSKLKDGVLRRNERLVYLVEREPFGPQGEAGYWADMFKTMEKWVKKLMPDSFIVIKTSIPACHFVGAGQFRQYVDALRYLLKTYPHHFNVELEDESIMDCDISKYFPTNSDEFNPEKQAQYLDIDRVCTLHGYDRGAIQLRGLAETEEQHRRLNFQARSGRRNEPIDYDFIDRFVQNRYEELKQGILDSLQARLDAKCNHIASEFAYIRDFVRDVKYFQTYGTLPNQQPQPFKSMKPEKKSRTKAVELVYTGYDARREEEIDPVAEAKKIVAVLPWIQEECALQHMRQMVEMKKKDPRAEYPLLEVPLAPVVELEEASILLVNDTTRLLEPRAPLLGIASGNENERKRVYGEDSIKQIESVAKKPKASP